MSERRERTGSIGLVRRPGAERLTGPPATRLDRSGARTEVVDQ